MSRRVDIFREVQVHPVTADNFWVYSPILPVTTLVMAEECSLPFPKYNEITLYKRGNAYKYPGSVSVPGDWTCTFTDNIAGLNLYQQLLFLSTLQSPFTGLKKFPVIIAITISNTEIPIPHALYELESAWVKGVEPVTLKSDGSGDPLRFKVTFGYNSIKNVYLAAGNADVFNPKEL